MPTLMRFLTILTIIAGIGFGIVVALATLVKPNTGEITERIPAERLNPRPVTPEGKAEGETATGSTP